MVTMTDSLTGEFVLAERLRGGRFQRIAAGNPPLPIGAPDGQLLATEIPRGGAMVVMRRDGTRLRELEPGTEAQDFSFDSKQLLYYSRRSGNSDLYILDILTGATTQVTATPEDEVDANFLVDSTIVLQRGVRTAQLMRAELGSLLRARP
jgi:hypothetical protein